MPDHIIKPDETLKFDVLPGVTEKRGGIHNNHTGRDTCGDCAYFRFTPKNVKIGICYGNPPASILTPQGQQFGRPMIASDDYACRHFKENE
jgi:hypothetical protein